MVRDPLVLLYKRSFQKIQWPLWRLHCAVGWTGSQRTAASTRIKTCNFAGHLQMTLAEGENIGDKGDESTTSNMDGNPLYLECYMIMHCKGAITYNYNLTSISLLCIMQSGFKFHIKQADTRHFHIKLMPKRFSQRLPLRLNYPMIWKILRPCSPPKVVGKIDHPNRSPKYHSLEYIDSFAAVAGETDLNQPPSISGVEP